MSIGYVLIFVFRLKHCLADHVELNVVDGMILPNLKMVGEDEHCIFLNQEQMRHP